MMLGPCEETTGALASNGYGAAWLNGRWTGAHRKAYIKAYGHIPKGLVVRHKCDNKACIRLDHLELGTPKQNSEDMVARGRARGGRPVVHGPEVRAMVKALILLGYFQAQIARIVRVSTAFVSHVRNNRTTSPSRSRPK